MTWFDAVVLAVIVLSAVMSLGRGLIREAFSVMSFVIGGLAAFYALAFFEKPLKGVISPKDESMIPAAILVVVGFIAAYSLAAFLGGRLSKLIHSSPEIGVIDRIAGAVFGIFRGLLASILFVLLMQQILPENATPQPIAKSYSYPYLSGAASWIRSTVPGFVKSATEAIREPVPDSKPGN
ncbi:MAG TPA: CvpA family protein [Hyphomonadaceae bacterium]|nr:CvpA family protein [Hyphomonadaceae bacterium]